MFHILKYSIEMWGEAQARIYQSKFLHAYDLILDNPHIGKSRVGYLMTNASLPWGRMLSSIGFVAKPSA